jgi:hypothetical protein
MDQAGSDYVLAGRVLHAGSIVMTHAVEDEFCEVRGSKRPIRRGSRHPTTAGRDPFGVETPRLGTFRRTF